MLTRDPAKHPAFQVRNIAANGEVWTGTGSATTRIFPALAGVPRDDWPTENMCSQGIRVPYGRFDYYTGGDIPGRPRPGYPDWHDVERPVAKAVGPVDVAVVNHHGNRDSTNDGLSPRCGRAPGFFPCGPRIIPATTCSTGCIRRASIPDRAMSLRPT